VKLVRNGETLTGAALATAAYTWSETSNEFILNLGWNASNEQVVQIITPGAPLAPLLSVARARTAAPLPAGGRPGAFFKNYAIAAAGRARATIYDIDYAAA